jgi:putative transposase
VKSAEGAIDYSAPQIADRREPFRSRIREAVRGRTEELEALAVEISLAPGRHPKPFTKA